MKKQILLLSICVLFSISSFAQKFGHINAMEVLQAMPGIDSVQTKLMDFQKELQIHYENMENELQTKLDKFDKEAGTMSASVRKDREDELNALYNRIQGFKMTVQDDIEEEQMRLIAPFQEKVQNAINDVAKEYKYTYIFTTQALLYYEGGDDIMTLVKKKLGIK
jgi:outer membrane protein